jgi:hypothetical protein
MFVVLWDVGAAGLSMHDRQRATIRLAISTKSITEGQHVLCGVLKPVQVV